MEGGDWINPFQGAVGNAAAGNAPLGINENDQPGIYENIIFNDPNIINNNVDVRMFNNEDANMFNNMNVNMFNNINAVPPAYRRDPGHLVINENDQPGIHENIIFNDPNIINNNVDVRMFNNVDANMFNNMNVNMFNNNVDVRMFNNEDASMFNNMNVNMFNNINAVPPAYRRDPDHLVINENDQPGIYENIIFNDPNIINNNVDVRMFNNVDANMLNNMNVNMFNNINAVPPAYRRDPDHLVKMFNINAVPPAYRRDPDHLVNMFNNINAVPQAYRRDPDHLMPIANINRIMGRILPAHAKVSEETKELLQECTSKFIAFVTAKANERCRLVERNTVKAEDILFALSRLGFENYVGLLTVYLNRYRHSDVPQTMVRGDPSVRRTTYFPGAAPAPPPPPLPFPVAHHYHPMLHNFVNAGPDSYQGQPFFDPAAAMNQYYYFQNATFASSSNAGGDGEPDGSNQASSSSWLPPPPPL